MKLILKTIIISFSVFFWSCKEEESKLSEPELILGNWIESQEEGCGIFRPENYKNFEPISFRQTYSFKENGQCEYLVLSPTDAHYMETGFWTYDNEQKHIKIFNQDNELFTDFYILSLSKNLLEITSYCAE